MKKSRHLLILFPMALALVGCLREDPDATGVKRITIRAEVSENPFSKASFTIPDSGKGLHLAWQGTDNIRVINHSNPSQSSVYTIQPGYTDHVAYFEGDEVSGTSFDILCPGTYENVAAAVAGNSDLTQDGNDSPAHLVFTALLSDVAKDDLSNISFNGDWAATHGATFKRGGIVKFILTLPDVITAPQKVSLITEESVSSVKIVNVNTAADHVLTAYAPCSWDDEELSWEEFTVSVMDGNGDVYSITKEVEADDIYLMGGAVNTIRITDNEVAAAHWVKQLFAGGNGSQASPYLIANANQLDNMHEIEAKYRAGSIAKRKYCFRLIEDIELESYLSSKEEGWTPLNMISPYDFEVDLDGDGYTVNKLKINSKSGGSNQTTGFFGVLYGSAHDIIFTNADVANAKGNHTGILCAYAGYKIGPAHIYNVHVNGKVRYTASSNAGVGGLAGVVYNCLLESSSAFDIDVLSSKNYNGGLFGRDDNSGSTIRNCWTSGQVGALSSDGTQRKGGICGGIIKSYTTIINCFSTAKVLGTYCLGGIVGHANLDKNPSSASDNNHPTKTKPYNIIQGCIAWNDAITSRATDSSADHFSSGAIVGYTSTQNTYTNCGFKSDISFKDYKAEWVPYTQNNCNALMPLEVNSYSGFNYHYPLHGRYSFTGTLSAAAKSLGWSETVWNLDGPIPVLTGAVEQDSASGASDVPAGSRGDGPIYPSNGNGWTVSTIDSGITYYEYDGYPSACDNTHQNAFIVDVDLNNPSYKVQVVGATPSCALSQLFKATKAVAAINGAYEIGSIALKVNADYAWSKTDTSKGNDVLDNVKTESVTQYPNGLAKSYMPNNTITDTGVDNWKNQGTFYSDGSRGIQIAFDAYDPSKAPGGEWNPPVKDILQERLFYQLYTGERQGFMSSAPVLIENYNAVGLQFKTWYPKRSGEASEAPNTHQTSLYPRTAVALMENNHLLLVAVDGRYTSSAGGVGMSAYWLTRFLKTYFNPQYALNLDGGGSTTMCVEGKGDANTHVVNYPCDNRGSGSNIHNHDGQRDRDSHIVVVRVN